MNDYPRGIRDALMKESYREGVLCLEVKTFSAQVLITAHLTQILLTSAESSHQTSLLPGCERATQRAESLAHC